MKTQKINCQKWSKSHKTNLKNCGKIKTKSLFIKKSKISENISVWPFKKCQFSNIRSTQLDQSSPVQPVSESWGGPLSLTEEKDN